MYKFLIVLIITMLFPNFGFTNVAKGVNDGLWWCRTEKDSCHFSVKKRLVKRYNEYKPYWEKYSGGKLSWQMALTSATEAPAGPKQCSKDKVLKECGIMGLKWKDAEKYDVDVCNVEASIWASSYDLNYRYIGFLKKNPSVLQLPLYEIYPLVGLSASVGPSANKLLKYSGALSVNKAGKLVYSSPFDRLLMFMRKLNGMPKVLDKIMFNRRFSPYILGFRVGRVKAVLSLLLEFYKVKEIRYLPFRLPELPERPKGLPEYPGYAKHGKCK